MEMEVVTQVSPLSTPASLNITTGSKKTLKDKLSFLYDIIKFDFTVFRTTYK